MAAPRTHTKPCPQCGRPMPKQRGVCAECGGMTTWFKVRLAVGCISMLLAVLGMAAVIALALLSR